MEELGLGEVDNFGIGAASMDLFRAMLAQPETVLAKPVEMAQQWTALVAQTLGGTFFEDGATPALIEPAPGDNRWKHPAWTENAIFDALKQSYLLASKTLLDSLDTLDNVDPAKKARIRFFVKQFIDAMSPTNFALTNPAVIEETFRSGGKNLERGAKALAKDALETGRVSLVDKTTFKVGENLAISKGDVVFRNELIELIEYAPKTESVYARPLLVVPPWINKFYILDLSPENSFVDFAVSNGLRLFVISWRNPDASLGRVSFEDYLRFGPLAAIGVIREITGSPDVNQIGYCAGGTLSAVELAYLAKTDPKLVKAVTLFAALTDFEEVGEMRAFLAPESLARLEKSMTEKGVLESRQMADAFSMLRANDLIWNVAVDRYLMGKPAPAFDLLYWNDDATRMPAAMHVYYLKNFYVRNALARGELEIDGVKLELGAIRNDAFVVATIDDHITPWKSVYKATQSFGGEVTFRLGHSGHIAGVINPPHAKKGHHWRNAALPPEPEWWLGTAEKVEGSWWPEWLEWIAARSGERIPASAGHTQKYPALAAAPGTYVFG